MSANPSPCPNGVWNHTNGCACLQRAGQAVTTAPAPPNGCDAWGDLMDRVDAAFPDADPSDVLIVCDAYTAPAANAWLDEGFTPADMAIWRGEIPVAGAVQLREAGVPTEFAAESYGCGWTDIDGITAMHAAGIENAEQAGRYHIEVDNGPDEHTTAAEIAALHKAYGSPDEYRRWKQYGLIVDSSTGRPSDRRDFSVGRIAAATGYVEQDLALKAAFRDPEQAVEWQARWMQSQLDVTEREVYNSYGAWVDTGMTAGAAADWFRAGYEPHVSALLDHAGYEAPLEGWQGERNVTTRKWMMDADTPERVIEAYNECQASDPEGEVTAARLVDALTGQGSLLGAP